MKRSIILTGLVALSLASCIKDEVKGSRQGSPIDFRVAIETKGTETSTATLENFTATAIDGNGDIYFSNLLFAKEDNGTLFASDPEYYWPSYGELVFYAFSHSDRLADISITKDAQTFSFTPESEIADQIDVVAVKTVGSNRAEGMELILDHCLCQIKINAKNTNSAYKYLIEGVKIANVAGRGTYDFENWDITASESTDYTVTYDSPVELTTDWSSLMGTGGNALLIPQELTSWDGTGAADADEQTGSYIAILVNITTADSGVQVFPETDGEYGWVAVGNGTTWEPGYRYVYNLDFSNGAGQDESTGESVFGEALKFNIERYSGFSSYTSYPLQ